MVSRGFSFAPMSIRLAELLSFAKTSSCSFEKGKEEIDWFRLHCADETRSSIMERDKTRSEELKKRKKEGFNWELMTLGQTKTKL